MFLSETQRGALARQVLTSSKTTSLVEHPGDPPGASADLEGKADQLVLDR